jgi:hypothetical protein
MNGTFTVEGTPYCGACFEQMVSAADEAELAKSEIVRQTDPTICFNCNADGNRDEWPLVAGLPACETCTTFFRNRPFPTWLKISFVGFLLLAGLAFAHNWRFFMAYVEMVRGQHIVVEGDFQRGVALLDSAASRVPEFPEMAVLPNLLKAQLLVQEDPKEAIRLLKKSRPYAPPDWREAYQRTQTMAEQSLAFDQRDFDTFLAKSQELAELYPQDPYCVGSVASAFACKYASTGDPSFRDRSLEEFDRAKQLTTPDDPNFQEYEVRIRHRLHTREIITAQEFHQRYPNGWTEETEG